MLSVPCPARHHPDSAAANPTPRPSFPGLRPGRWSALCIPVLAFILAGIGLLTGNLQASGAKPVVLAWNPNPEPNIAGYILRYGTASGKYNISIDVGPRTNAEVRGLTAGVTYYFAISAYNRAGLSSRPSSEVVFKVPSPSAQPLQPIPRTGWRVMGVTSQEAPAYAAALAFDGRADTFWHTAWKKGTKPHPHEIRIDLGSQQRLGGFRYLPRQDGFKVGTIAKYEFFVSGDGVKWGKPVARGSFAATTNEKQVLFRPVVGRYIMLRSLAEMNGLPDTHVAELNVLRASSAPTSPSIPPLSAPAFASKVIRNSPARVGTTYKGKAVKANSAASANNLTYTKISGPSWLKVSPSGALSGTPPLLAAGMNRFTIRAKDRNGKTADTVLQIPVQLKPLPLPWKIRQLSPANPKALAIGRNQTFTMAGAGRLAGRADGGALVWRTLGPQGEVIARINQISGRSQSSRAGLMVRASAASNSPNVFIGIDASKRFVRSRRSVPAGPTLAAPRGKAPAKMAWVRLVRRGDSVTTFTSSDGRRWRNAGTVQAKLGRNCLVGLYLGSPQKSRIQAMFSRVRVISKPRS